MTSFERISETVTNITATVLIVLWSAVMIATTIGMVFVIVRALLRKLGA